MENKKVNEQSIKVIFGPKIKKFNFVNNLMEQEGSESVSTRTTFPPVKS